MRSIVRSNEKVRIALVADADRTDPSEVDRLLDEADEAVDRRDWDAVERLATAALAVDPECADATGLLALAERRRARAMRRPEPVAADGPRHGSGEFEAERRTLTVMFCDLVGSTEIAERHDPEDTRIVLQWYHQLVGEAVSRYGGHVARYMGDGALVYFGWPTAMDDSALCAVRAALDLLRGVDAERSSLRDRVGTNVEVRIGIHTGLVVVGEMGSADRREHGDVVGETPNVAARLEGLARPGTIVVSAETYGLLRERVDATSLGPRQLKGVGRPIHVYQVRDLVARPTRFTPGRIDTEMVGRDAELAELRRAMADASTADRPSAVAVSAEPGVGKSRLLETFLGSFDGTDDVTVIRAQCNEFLTGTAFQPLLSATWHRGPADESAAMTPAFGDPFEHGVGDDGRDALLGIVVDALVSAGGTGPLVVAVEDVHWADPSTLDVLARLAVHPVDRPVTVVATHRPGLELDWEASATTISLAPLERPDFDRLVELLTVDHPISARIRDQLFDRTAGVPLFVEELVSSLIDSENTDPGSAGQVEIPAGLNDVLVNRLDRCGPAKRTGQIASVFGRSVTVDLLGRVAGTTHLTDHLDVLVRAGVLERDGADRVTFRHALVQDAAYSTMLRSTARAIHASAAAAIVDLLPEAVEQSPEVVARHLHRAGSYREALDLYRAAADQSNERSAFHETVAHLTGALACLEELDGSAPETELELLLQLGPALQAARGYGSAEVMQTYERAAQLTGTNPESVEAFDVLHGLTAFFLVSEDLVRSTELAASMMSHAVRTKNTADLAEAEAWLGTSHFFRGDLDAAEAMLGRSVDGARLEEHHRPGSRAGLDPATLALSHLTWLHLLRGDLLTARQRRDEMLAHAETLDSAVGLAHSLNYAAGMAVMTGDTDSALRYAADELAVADEAGLPHYVAYAQILAAAARRPSDPSGAAEQLRAGLRLRRDTGARLAIAFHHALLADLELAAGRLDEAQRMIDNARRLAIEHDERWWYPEIERVAGAIEIARGRPDEATACLNRSLDTACAMGAHALSARARETLADL